MRVLVVGATGSVGVHVIEQSLAAGHTVTAFVRTPSKLTIAHPNLSVAQGDAIGKGPELEEAVRGQDAVVVVLGAGLRGRVRAEGTQRVIEAMNRTGVRRLVAQSTLGAGDSFQNLNLKWRFVFRVPLRQAMADHELQEEYVRKSGLEWTIVRPAAFTDGPQTGSYQHGFSSSKGGLQLTVSRADVADFLLRQLDDDAYLQKTVSLSD